MKVLFKCITQESFELELEPTDTILNVKEKINATQGERFAVEGVKLIYNGKVLENEDTVEAANFDAKKFVVVVVKPVAKYPPVEPKKDTPAPTPAASASTTAPAPAQEIATAANAPATPAAPEPLNAENQAKLNDLVAMGYPEAEATNALRAAFYDTNRAVEYLLNGIPEGIAVDVNAPQPEAVIPEGAAGGLDFLANNEQFAQLRAVIRQNPNLLPELLGQIATDNPELMNLIRENEAQFLDILNADAQDDDGAEGEGGYEGGEELPAGHVAIPINEEDRNAINRLKDMGFPEQLVIEAYLACDKNEGLAVDYILRNLDGE
uniref:UV excision repair protein RAD23 n=1 Tax=Panagrellus redivivus TaxID=6233 RepID=A0A7E5A1T7_PANRE